MRRTSGDFAKQCVGIEDAQAGIEAIKAGENVRGGGSGGGPDGTAGSGATSTAELTLERIVRGGRDE